MDKAIFLCGFMGAGKSTVGKALASKLGWKLLDTDELITAEHGPIPVIFTEKGEVYFRQLEAELADRLREREQTVISTGGGFILSKAVQAALQDCCIVYLDVPYDKCYERIKNSDRPLVRSNSKEELEAIYNKRAEIYKAVSTISVSNDTDLEKAVDGIIKTYKSM